MNDLSLTFSFILLCIAVDSWLKMNDTLYSVVP